MGTDGYLRVEVLYAATHEGALHLDDPGTAVGWFAWRISRFRSRFSPYSRKCSRGVGDARAARGMGL
jgi:hypothetical protein